MTRSDLEGRHAELDEDAAAREVVDPQRLVLDREHARSVRAERRRGLRRHLRQREHEPAGVGVPDARAEALGRRHELSVGAERRAPDILACPRNTLTSLPVRTSQTRAVLSPLAVTIRVPSRENSTSWIVL